MADTKDPNVDFKLSEHFSFFEATVTSKGEELQKLNRVEALAYLPAGKSLCQKLLEPIRGNKPLVINSAFRCWQLNGKTAGSSKTSQHLRFQAADIHRPGQDVGEFFKEVRSFLVENKIPFGQLLDESANRGYEVARWVHVSLGPDFWDPSRSGQIATMVDGEFTLIEKVDVLSWVAA